jgi:enoyl-CoA hydratase
MAQDEDTILYEERGPVALITFNRPDKLNAMNTGIVRRLIELFKQVDRSARVQVAVLTGTGRAFVAGADIGEYSEQDAPGFVEYQSMSRGMFEGIEFNRKPLIAAVNGYALGGGFELVLSCDLVVASRTAKLGLPEIQLGLLPGGGGTQKLGRIIGRNKAKEFLMTGRYMTAEEGYNLGVINRIAEPETTLEETLTLAEEIASKAPVAVRAAKRLVNQGLEAPLEAMLSYEGAVLSNLFQTYDAHEGIQAFVEKRKPQFKGK